LEPAPRRRILVDITPLRELRDYRTIVIAQLISVIGSQLTVVAIAYQVFRQTHSSFQVGAISLTVLFPLIAGSLIGGSVGDVSDRRTIMWTSSLALSLTSATLAINAAADRPLVWLLYPVCGVAGGLAGFSDASRAAASASLVGPRHQSAAAALNQIVFQTAIIAGPAAAGLLISSVGLPWVYGVDALTFVAGSALIFTIAPMPPVGTATKAGLRSIAEGLRSLRGNHPLQGIYLIDINAMVFGMPRALFPALAFDSLHVGVRGLGYLYAAPAVGAFLGSVGSGWVAHVRRQGLGVIVAVAVWGAAIVGFGLTHTFVVALVMLAVAGWADVISAVLRSTILQTTVTEEFRGRLTSVQMAVVQGGPRLGDFEAGTVASAVSTQFSVVSGGVACMAGAAVVAAALPGFRRHLAR
jgi:MFS family permease